MKSIIIGLAALLATAASAYRRRTGQGDGQLGRQDLDRREGHDALHLRQGRGRQDRTATTNAPTAWPPLAAAADAKAEGEWTVVDRTDGTKMWAYDGHPLYTFVEDKAPGDVKGDGKGGVWHVAKDE